MRFNERQLQLISQEEPDHQDRLSYLKVNANNSKNFKERWFKLKSNMLFYFKFTESGQIESKPAGVIILEGSHLQVEVVMSAPFSFALVFGGDVDRRYIFSAKSEEAVYKWMDKLSSATYEHQRKQIVSLRQSITNKFTKLEKKAPPVPPPVPARPDMKRQNLNSVSQPMSNEEVKHLLD